MRPCGGRLGAIPALVLPPLLLHACAESRTTAPATFDAALREERVVVLEEPDDAPIGGLGALDAGRGIFAVIDAQASELRFHDAASGRLVGRPGRAGEGPGELRRPLDVAIRGPTAWVADGASSALVGFPIDGGPHRSIPVSGGSARRVRSAPGGLLVGTAEHGQPRLSLIDVADGRVLGRFLHEDSADVATPYWGALADYPAVARSDGVVAAFNLRYPLRRFRWEGGADSLGLAPPSWRPARRPEHGEFAGRDGQTRLVSEYLGSFTTIDRVDAFTDGALLVTHGGFERRSAPGVPFRSVQHTVDAYGPDGRKLWEDLALPGRVLAVSGDTLHLLTAEPPDGWVVRLYTRRR